MNTSRWLVALGLAIPLLFAGCKVNDSKATDGKLYPIKGKVLAVDLEKPFVKLDHEDIPGLMQGMHMSFDVSDPSMLDGLKEGDQVEGQLKVVGGKYVITELKKR